MASEPISHTVARMIAAHHPLGTAYLRHRTVDALDAVKEAVRVARELKRDRVLTSSMVNEYHSVADMLGGLIILIDTIERRHAEQANAENPA